MIELLDLPEENLRSNITIPLGLSPGLADDATVVGAQDSGSFIFIDTHSGDGGSHSGGGSAGLDIDTETIVYDLILKV